MSCSECTGEQIANEAGTSCELCPDGKHVNSEVINSAFVSKSRETVLNVYKPCEVCEEGKFSNSVTGHEVCDDCAAGKFSGEFASVCIPCPAGSWSVAGQGSECRKCDSGKYSAQGAITCDDCASGKYSEKASPTCTYCIAGKTSKASEGSCSGCDSGKTSSGTKADGTKVPDGETQVDGSGPIQCFDCEGGKYANGLSTDYLCKDCEAGKASAGGGAFCPDCFPGKYSGIGQHDCTDCEPGKFNTALAQDTCTLCDIGKYQNDVGKEYCQDCDKGTVTDTTLSSDKGAATCKSCPAQTYKNDKCQLISDTEYPASRTCESTDAGKTEFNTCLACPAAKNSGEGSEICQSCPAGTVSFANSGVTECHACPAGKRSGVMEAQCVDCPAGKFSNVDVSDTTLDYSSSQSVNTLPSDVNDDCESGDSGKHTHMPEKQVITTTATDSTTPNLGGSFTFAYTNAADSKTVGPVIVKYNTKAIDLQTNFTEHSTVGNLDFADQLEEGDILVKRVSCVNPKSTCSWEIHFDGVLGDITVLTLDSTMLTGGTVAIVTATPGDNGQGKSTCTNCMVGRYKPFGGEFCKACAAGKKSADSTGSAICQDCTPGKYAEWGSTNCIDCEAGRYSNLDRASECFPCSPGTRRTLENDGMSCNPCDAGKYIDTFGFAGTECTLCATGKYQTIPGAISCDLCQAGKYADALGSIACKLCNSPGGAAEDTTEGKISKPGQDGCEDCPAGTASGLIPGVRFCTACPGGMYQNEVGKRSCEPCVAGKYQPNPEDVKPYNLTAPPPAPEPTLPPTAAPTAADPNATLAPSSAPTSAPTTSAPTNPGTTANPTTAPTSAPTTTTRAPTSAPTTSAPTSAPTTSPTMAPTTSPTMAPTIDWFMDNKPNVYLDVYGATQCRPCKPGTWSELRGEASDVTSGNVLVGKTECQLCPKGRYSDVWGTHPKSFTLTTPPSDIDGFPKADSLSSGCYKCVAGKYGIATRTECLTCDSPLKDKGVYSSYSKEEDDRCYYLATENGVHTCPESKGQYFSTATNQDKQKRSLCSWYFIDKFEENIGSTEKARNLLDDGVGHNEGVENPFGTTCDSFTMCKADPASDNKKDEYQMMCNKCSPGYMSAGRQHEIQTITTTGTGMTGSFAVTFVSTTVGVTHNAVEISYKTTAAVFGNTLSPSISVDLAAGDITVKLLNCADPATSCQWEVHFMGVYGNLAMMTVDGANLVGGTVAIAQTQEGSDGTVSGTTVADQASNCADKMFQSYCYRPGMLDFCPPNTVCEYWFGGSDETSWKKNVAFDTDFENQNPAAAVPTNISPFYTSQIVAQSGDKYPPVATSCAEYRICGFSLESITAKATASDGGMHKLNIACTECSVGFVSIPGHEKIFVSGTDEAANCPGNLPTTCMMLDGLFPQGGCPSTKINFDGRRKLLEGKRELKKQAKEDFERAVGGLRGTTRSLGSCPLCSCTGTGVSSSLFCDLSDQCTSSKTEALGCDSSLCLCADDPTVPDADITDAQVKCKYLYSEFEVDDDKVEWESNWKTRYSGYTSPFRPDGDNDWCEAYDLCLFETGSFQVRPNDERRLERSDSKSIIPPSYTTKLTTFYSSQDEYHLLCSGCKEDEYFYPAIDPVNGASEQEQDEDGWTCESDRPSPTHCYQMRPAKYEVSCREE